MPPPPFVSETAAAASISAPYLRKAIPSQTKRDVTEMSRKDLQTRSTLRHNSFASRKDRHRSRASLGSSENSILLRLCFSSWSAAAGAGGGAAAAVTIGLLSLAFLFADIIMVDRNTGKRSL